MNRFENIPFIGRDINSGEERVIGIVRIIGVDLYNVTLFNKDDVVWAEYNENNKIVALGIDTKF